jgi:hypothetical protein
MISLPPAACLAAASFFSRNDGLRRLAGILGARSRVRHLFLPALVLEHRLRLSGQDTHPRTRALRLLRMSQPIRCRRALKLLVASVVERRTLLLSSRR